MAFGTGDLLAAALSLRVTADTSGLEADLASKLTGAERQAVQSSQRVSSATGRMAEAGTASSARLQVATLRQTAAQESYNRLLRDGETDTGKLARAQATLITANGRVQSEQAKANDTHEKGAVSAQRLALALSAVGAAAIALTVKSIGAYRELGSEVRQLQRLTGDSAEASSRLRFEAKETGVSFGDLTVGLRTLEKHLATNDTTAKHLGVSLQDAQGHARPFSDIIGDIADRFAKMPDGAAKTSLAIQVFGRSGTNMLPFLDKGRAGLRGLGDEAARLGLVLDQHAIGQLSDATKASRDLSAAMDAVEVSIGRRALPAMTKLKEIGAASLNFVAQHQSLTAAAGAGTIAVGIFSKAGAAASNFNEIVTAGGAILQRFRTGSAVAANTALANSYRAVATAAGAAAEAEVAAGSAAGAGAGAGGAAGGAGLLARLGIVGGGGALGGLALRAGSIGRTVALGASAIDPVILASLLAGGDQTPKNELAANTQQGKLLGQFSYRNGAFYAGNQKVTDERAILVLRSSGVGPALNEQEGNAAMRFHPQLFTGASANVVQTQNRALADVLAGATPDQQLAARRAQLTAQGRQYATGIDIFSRAAPLTPRADPQAVQALDTARARAADAARRVTLDQQKLNALRATGKASTLQLAGAEETLRLAKERSAKATADVTDAEKKAHAERLPTARSLLGTLTSQANRAGQDAKAVERLYAVGLGPNVVQKIIAQNANQPGALEAIAKGVTPALAKKIQAQFHRLQFDGSIIAGTPDQWRKAGNDRAADFMAGVQSRFNQATAPVIAARIAGVRRRTDSQEPVTTRTRQRSLSGTPVLPHGA